MAEGEGTEKGLRLSYAADREPVPLIVVVNIGIATIEVQVVRVRRAIGSRRPVVPVRAAIVERAIVVVAGINTGAGTAAQEDSNKYKLRITRVFDAT